MAKKKSPKTQITREKLIEALLADFENWESEIKAAAAKETRQHDLLGMTNAELASEAEDACIFESLPEAPEVVGEFKDRMSLLDLIGEEADEHENVANDSDGAVAGAEHRGTDFQEALAIAWKLLTPEQRKQAFLEFKETHDFAAYDKKEVE